jgi:lipopolysaccharide/colanic/teichoic acid biosynthesis glycosyltransferase
MLREWDALPEFMKCSEVKKYYDILSGRRASLKLKRGFDLILSLILLIICAIPMVIIAILIEIDSKGGVFYRQERVTAYGKKFKIHKFRTMIAKADQMGPSVTVAGDNRITKIGTFLRKYRLDELPQLFDVFSGNMSFVGTRPETVIYVKKYTPEMWATLLLPAGITSEASIRYKDEASLLKGVLDAEQVYVEHILPEKMKYNLESIREFSFIREIGVIVRTLFAVLGKEYN